MSINALTSVHGLRLGMEGQGGRLILDGKALADTQRRYVAGGSALTLTVDTHAGKTILLDTAAGTTITLPAATGTGAVFEFEFSVIATSNSHIIQVANATDVMRGFVFIADTDSSGAASGFFAGATGDTITLNRSTTGSVTIGEKIKITDAASGVFQVEGFISGTGTVATPFSAAVS